MTSRHGVCRWNSQASRVYKRAHSLADPIGRKSNPRLCTTFCTPFASTLDPAKLPLVPPSSHVLSLPLLYYLDLYLHPIIALSFLSPVSNSFPSLCARARITSPLFLPVPSHSSPLNATVRANTRRIEWPVTRAHAHADNELRLNQPGSCLHLSRGATTTRRVASFIPGQFARC